MPYVVHERLPLSTLKNISYGFFTNERGNSTGGYVIAGHDTRNVSLISPQVETERGYDPAANVVSNLMLCFDELTSSVSDELEVHRFVMTSNYGKGGARVLAVEDTHGLDALKRASQSELSSLGLHEAMLQALSCANVHAIKADAMVFKGIPGHIIAAGGPSGDAHPIVLIDDENKIAAYVSGPHAALKEDVLEKTTLEMMRVGARKENIRLVIGPGLGPKSYEFGANAAEYLKVPPEVIDDVKKPDKKLLDIAKITKYKLRDLLSADQVLDMEINTMAFDLYDDKGERKSSVDFSALSKRGPLFFSARREIMATDGLGAENTGLHNTVGRHFAGITLRG